MNFLTKIQREESQEYFIEESKLCKAIIKECDRALNIEIKKNCENVFVHLEMKNNDIDYKLSFDLYSKIEKKILRIKYINPDNSEKGNQNESRN